jgi:hypothetical protein
MSHNVGRIVTVTGTRIGPDTGTPPTTPGVWELAFTPQPALTGGTPRFVLLHLTAMSLPGTSRIEPQGERFRLQLVLLHSLSLVEAW